MKIIRPIRSIARRLISIFRDNVSVNVVNIGFNEILKDQVILLTGSTGGLGQEFAQAFLKAGAKLILCARNTNKLTDLKERLINADSSYEERIHTLIFNVNDINQYERVFSEAIAFYGHIDSLINNAGVIGASIPQAKPDDYDNIMSTNLRSAFFLSQIAIKYFRDNNIMGHILNIASSSSIRPAFSAYSLSKWGIRGLTLGLAKLGAPYGITVNAIAPGPTATPMLGKKDSQDLSLPFSPIGRYIHPVEIANMAVVLISSCGRSIIGDVIYMTGGAGTITFDDDEIVF